MKNVLTRLWFGAALGVLIGYFTNLVINLCVSNGEYMAAMPQLVALCGNALRAVVVQTVLTAAIGVVFAEAGLLFELAHWSFLRQCLVHFAVTAVFYLPFVTLCWFPLRWESLFGVLGSVLLTYAINFIINYVKSRQDVAQINARVRENRLQQGRN